VLVWWGHRAHDEVPDELAFISWFTGGEVFRSGCCFRRGLGRISYFGVGHQEWPVFHQREVGQVLANAVAWANDGGETVSAPAVPLHAPAGWFEP
jgi:trehalose utilization protein